MFDKNPERRKAKVRTVKNIAFKGNKTGRGIFSATVKIADAEPKIQVIGVEGGSIEPTPVDVKLFKDALGSVVSSENRAGTLSKLGMSERKYNSAWQHALSNHSTEVNSTNELTYGKR
ncbi:hypothetical protein [uncultured Aquimarina sp.]|uniref:hypothetical protein n=1 Tax=uncultured Aquimarina sp. TaxID=575652 RepID=UPI002619125D|nr:hypothetical protein [uncultured Aquimarina sp.]